MEITQIDTTVLLQVAEMAVHCAFLTVAFIGGLVIGFGLVAMILGDQGEDE